MNQNGYVGIKIGKKIGLEKWNNYKNSNSGYTASKESLVVFDTVTDKIKDLVDYEDIFYGVENSFEYKIESGDKLYAYDYTIVSLNLIFEFNGSHVHPSKEKLSDTEWQNWRSPWTKETADEKYKADRDKIQIAENNGFTVIEVWDYEDKDLVIDMCVKLIKERT